MRCFCSDIDATKTAEIIGLNRNTLNRYFTIFREAILKKQLSDKKSFLARLNQMKPILEPKDYEELNIPQKRGRGRGTWKQAVFGVLPKQDQQRLMV